MTETSIREHLHELVDPLPIDLEARLAAVRSGGPKRPTGRWAVAAFALGLAAAAVAFAIWAFSGHEHVRPSAVVSNGRIAFVDFAPGYVPPKIGGVIPNTDLYTMKADGTDVRQLTSGRDTDLSPSWSPDGSRFAFIRGLSDGSRNVFVANADGSSVEQITFCRYAGCVKDVAWSPTEGVIAYPRGRDIYLIQPDGSENHLIYRCECSFIDLAWSPDGARIAFTAENAKRNFTGLLLVVNADGSDARTLEECDSKACTAGGQDASPGWSPDGVWIAFSRESNIWEIRPDGTGLHRLTDCPRARLLACGADRPVWSPDGTRIVFQQRDGIYLMKADGTGVARIRKKGYVGAWQPILVNASPTPSSQVRTANDGLVVERVPSCGFGLCSGLRGLPAIVVTDADGSNAHAIGRGTEPAASPNGQRIAFKGLDGDLYVMNRDGSGVRRVFDCRGPACHGMHHPTWSPDGTRLAFEGVMERDGAMRSEIYVVGADGSGLQRVTTCERPACAEHTSPAWSPDGRSIAFLANVLEAKPRAELYGTDIRVVDLASRLVRTRYPCPPIQCTFEGGLDWAPDGSRLVFGLSSGLTVIDADGSNLRQLTTTPQDFFPNWSPDGRLIAFTRYPGGRDAGIYAVDVATREVTVVIPGSDRWDYLFPSWQPR